MMQGDSESPHPEISSLEDEKNLDAPLVISEPEFEVKVWYIFYYLHLRIRFKRLYRKINLFYLHAMDYSTYSPMKMSSIS